MKDFPNQASPKLLGNQPFHPLHFTFPHFSPLNTHSCWNWFNSPGSCDKLTRIRRHLFIPRTALSPEEHRDPRTAVSPSWWTHQTLPRTQWTHLVLISLSRYIVTYSKSVRKRGWESSHVWCNGWGSVVQRKHRIWYCYQCALRPSWVEIVCHSSFEGFYHSLSEICPWLLPTLCCFRSSLLCSLSTCSWISLL